MGVETPQDSTTTEPGAGRRGVSRSVAIDIETGAFETEADEIAASHRLLAHNPEAQIWFRLVGSPYTRRFGPRSRAAA